MFIPGVNFQMRYQLEAMLASTDQANVVTAKLHWRTVVRPEGYDKNDESSAEGTVITAHSQEFRTFFHQVDHRLSGFTRFIEVETGDVILDYLADLALEGKEDLRVEIGGVGEVLGKFYTQKTASTGLLEAWDVAMENGGLMKSLLLSPVG